MPTTTRKKQLAIQKKVKARDAITPSHRMVLKERRKRRDILKKTNKHIRAINENDDKILGYTKKFKIKKKKVTLPIAKKSTMKKSERRLKLEELSCDFEATINKSEEFDKETPLSWFRSNLQHLVEWKKVSTPSLKLPKVGSKAGKDIWLMYFDGIPYVHVAFSPEDRGLGCFASKTFEEGEPIGIYIGYKQCSSPSRYRLGNIDAADIKSYLLCGLHFVNDPYFELGNIDDAEEAPNCIFYTNYLCVARRRIEKDEELLFPYGWKLKKQDGTH